MSTPLPDNDTNYAIATFCFGARYYSQVNRLIDSLKLIDNQPQVFIVTDQPEQITKADYVNVCHIDEFNKSYSSYKTDYYTFDFSVKRFSLRYALSAGFNKIILTDADAVVNPALFARNTINKVFDLNVISGQVVYNYNEAKVIGPGVLGGRFNHYENRFGITFDKRQLTEMPEDCIQFFNIDTEIFNKFLQTWDECIDIKYKDCLLNTPAGNIDEICFAALKNGITVKGHAHKAINMLIARHDKWYADSKRVNTNMSKLDSFYDKKIKEIGSDIFEHMPTLMQYASKCKHVTEFGTRWGSSTCAFLKASPARLISYDLYSTPDIQQLIEISIESNINFEFKLQNVTDPQFTIAPTELLFIDTLHTYVQLSKELNMHSDSVSKYIILHDTETFKHVGEDKVNSKGLWDAVTEFVQKGLWRVEAHYTHNNGLTVLQRI